jgi:hypothetical protein
MCFVLLNLIKTYEEHSLTEILIDFNIFENQTTPMDNPIRCGWCLSSDLYKEYHDKNGELRL